MRQSTWATRTHGFPGERLVILPPGIVAKAARQPVTRDLCITHIGAFVAARGHFVERVKGTAEHILIGCVSGGGFCTLGGREWSIAPGELLFLPPRAPHAYHAHPENPWTIFWFHFRGLRVGDYLAALGVSPEAPVLPVEDPHVLTDAFEDSFRHTLRGFGDSAMTGLSTAFVRLLGLARVHRRAPGARTHRTEGRLHRVLAKMREQPAKPWTLAELAAAAGLSIPHFSELCRHQTGLPPLSLLIRLRLQLGMDLLQQGKHNVAEAARAAGYDDPFYFSRLFRKHMGVTPNACRGGP